MKRKAGGRRVSGGQGPVTERVSVVTTLLQVGIDPGSKECVGRAVDQYGVVQGKPIRFRPNREGVERLVARTSALAPEAERRFYVEASGSHWYGLVGWLQTRNETASLICPSYTKAQRRVSSRYAKSDVRDAEALARAAFQMGERAQHPADLPEGPRLNLRLLCRHRYRLQRDSTAIKLRLLGWLGFTTPGLAEWLGGDFSAADRALIGRYPVVARALRRGKARVREFLERHAQRPIDEATIDALFELARQAYSPRDLDDQLVAEQFRMELERLALNEKLIRQLDARIAQVLPLCDPHGWARSLPGVGVVVAPILVAEAGTDLSRFANPHRFAAWAGVVGRAHGTAGQQTEGLPITKAGRGIVKSALFMAANVARQRDPHLRAVYEQLRAKGRHHNQAVIAVARRLAELYWHIMTEQRPYSLEPPRDPSGPTGQPAPPSGRLPTPDGG
jgi:transposase